MSAPRRIHQLVHTLSYGDAISTEVLALQRCLREHGAESEIFAINEHPNLRGRSKPYAELLNVESADVVLHYSLGSPLNDLYRNWTRGQRSLIYHNITPVKWYEQINQRVARDIEHGLSELPGLCAISDLRISDSPFNASELSNLGFDCEVLDLLVDPARWEVPRNQGIYDLVTSTPGMHLLHVGRLAPNKCVEDIIKSFYFLHHVVEPQSRLWLVGIDTDTELYSFSLRRLAAELHVEKAIEFVGCLSDQEVRALYEACSVYVCMSEHEGFCLPIVEAMHFGLPVVAYAAGAVPDTVGNGGVLIREKRHAEMAELISKVHRDASLRERLVAAGRAQVSRFTYDVFSARVKEILLSARSQPEATNHSRMNGI